MTFSTSLACTLIRLKMRGKSIVAHLLVSSQYSPAFSQRANKSRVTTKVTTQKKACRENPSSLLFYWSWRWESNPRPADYKSCYLYITYCFYLYFNAIFCVICMTEHNESRPKHAKVTQASRINVSIRRCRNSFPGIFCILKTPILMIALIATIILEYPYAQSSR